jgi:hypothetical protein
VKSSVTGSSFEVRERAYDAAEQERHYYSKHRSGCKLAARAPEPALEFFAFGS